MWQNASLKIQCVYRGLVWQEQHGPKIRQEETMTRTTLLMALVAGTLLSGATPSFAYPEGPWCLKAMIGRSATNICHFRTFEQCLAERSFYGGSSFCGQNPRYLPYWRARGQNPL